MKRAIEDKKREKKAVMQAAANLEYKGNFFPQNGDYVGEDGIVVCGQCGTKRGYWAKPFEESYGTGELIIIPDKCDCQKKRESAEVERKERTVRQTEQEERRQRFLKSEAYRTIRVGNSDLRAGNATQLSCGMKYAQAIIKGETNKGLVFSGGCGTGKTHIAACVANELIDNGKTAYIDTTSGMMQSVFKKETEVELMQLIDTVDLFIIDDFGAERDTAYTAEKIFEIVDRRIRSKKPLLVTTNLTENELKKPTNTQQQRSYSRILSVCGVMVFNNSDIRVMREAEQTKAELQKLFG